MVCRNCGSEMSDFDTMCNNCGEPVAVPNYSTVKQNSAPIKITSLLVWSIIEIFCINPITGIIGIILWAIKLKPAADRGDINEVLKTKKIIKIILWVGFGLGFLVIALLLIPMLIAAVMLPMVNSASNVGNSTQDMVDDLRRQLNESAYVYEDDEYRNNYYDFDYID